jgi:hypothetical protein
MTDCLRVTKIYVITGKQPGRSLKLNIPPKIGIRRVAIHAQGEELGGDVNLVTAILVEANLETVLVGFSVGEAHNAWMLLLVKRLFGGARALSVDLEHFENTRLAALLRFGSLVNCMAFCSSLLLRCRERTAPLRCEEGARAR